mmetsp:Transcript_2490/g.3798  ORF Transcript_2490/g.3798 Transcript_2490/m.3798 type:complete len:293 (+) Transcript_2490:224-1102(+)
MKFSLSLLNVAFAAATMPSVSVASASARHGHVSSLDSTHLFPDADFRVDIDAATHSSDASNNGQSYDSRAYGKASVFPAFIRKMQEATGKIVNLPEGYSYHDAQVQTLYLTESSRRHTDSRIEGMTSLNPNDPDGSLTAFYVQESTADAYFDTDDDEVCIPFVEGSAIYFNGGLPHRSIVKSGAVKLVGPFLLKGLEAVGVGSSPTRIPTRPPTGPPTRSPTTPPTTFPTASPTTSKASKVKASKAPKVAVGESTSTLQVQKMTSGGSSVPQTSLAGVWLVSLLSLGAFFSF